MDALERNEEAIIQELINHIGKAWSLMTESPQWQQIDTHSDEDIAWMAECTGWRSAAFGLTSRIYSVSKARAYADVRLEMALEKSQEYTKEKPHGQGKRLYQET